MVAPSALDVARLRERFAWKRYTNIARLAAYIGVLCSPFSLWALFWTSPKDYPFLSSMLWVPVATLGCVLLFSRTWKRDKFNKLLFGAGITMRLAAAGAFVWLGFFVFGVSADAFHYSNNGVVLASHFPAAGWAVFQPPWTSSNLIMNICGIITLVTGDAMPALMVLFSFAALWGAYFFYRAFCIAFPHGDRGLYGLLIVLLPSLAYWSSAIGKDALEQLFIGLSAYGFARLVTKLSGSAILVCGIGITGAALVRPHIGALLAVSMLGPFTFGRAKSGWMTTSVKILLIPLLAGGTLIMISQARSFVGVEGSDFQSNVNRLKLEGEYTNLGGSTFNQGESLPRRMLQGPFLPFRPFPWEVHNAMAAVAALEGLLLIFFAWRRRRSVKALVRRWREPYVLFILMFIVEFSLIFSAGTSNFGILVRERIMMVPIFLMLFCAIPQYSQPAARVSIVNRDLLLRRAVVSTAE